jgi:release factor glutamine methyltransferase
MQSLQLYQELLDMLQAGWTGLPEMAEETPRTCLQTLWRFAGGPESILASEINLVTEQRIRSLVEQRLGGEPLAYLTGRQVFMGIEFISSPEAMIPRRETEILAKAALELAKQLTESQNPINVVDLCTGSGNIALTLAYFEPGCRVIGVDLSENAVQLAQRNAQHLGLSNQVQFHQGDMFSTIESSHLMGQIDLVTCNPPYISSMHVEKLPQEIILHEPRMAFDGGSFGIKILLRLVRDAPRFLKAGGWVCFEIGQGQGKPILNMLNKSNQYQNIHTFQDDAGEIRTLQAQISS